MDATGRKKLTGVSRSGVSNCPNASATIQYDANGFIDYELDWNGARTESTYDARGLLEDQTTGINGAFPGKQRFTDYVWDTSTNLLLAVRTYGTTTSEPLAETTYEY